MYLCLGVVQINNVLTIYWYISLSGQITYPSTEKFWCYYFWHGTLFAWCYFTFTKKVGVCNETVVCSLNLCRGYTPANMNTWYIHMFQVLKELIVNNFFLLLYTMLKKWNCYKCCWIMKQNWPFDIYQLPLLLWWFYSVWKIFFFLITFYNLHILNHKRYFFYTL